MNILTNPVRGLAHGEIKDPTGAQSPDAAIGTGTLGRAASENGRAPTPQFSLGNRFTPRHTCGA